jgi:glycosyltransferase involved in cell wall biosynthesis
MRRPIRVQMLVTDGFGGIGGIAKFNRDFLAALDASPVVERVHALPRLITEPIQEVIPETIIYHRRAACGRIAFAKELLAQTLWGERMDFVICGHLNLLPMAWLVAKYWRARLVLIVHGYEAFVPSPRRLSNLLVHRIDAFIAVSRYSRDRFMEWSKIPSERGFILPNCVDTAQFHPGERDPTLVARHGLQSKKVVLTVGRMAAGERYKGFDEVIDVMPRLLRRFPDLRYLIVGDGSDRVRLEAKVRALDLTNHVIFTGQVPEAEKVAHYNLADAYVMPSYGEGFGITLIEAAACGIPIVGSSADGSREALLNGELGWIIDPTAPDQLTEAITAAINARPTNARNSLIETFDTGRFRARVSDWMSKQSKLALA